MNSGGLKIDAEAGFPPKSVASFMGTEKRSGGRLSNEGEEPGSEMVNRVLAGRGAGRKKNMDLRWGLERI